MSKENSIILEHDFTISYTLSKTERTVKDLKYIETDWSKFLDAIKTPRIDEKRTNGCFIGGKVINHRNNENTVDRSMLTIDLDDVPPDFEDMFTHISSLYGGAFALYSTHNHTPELPRYRLVIPIDKAIPISANQYRSLIKMITQRLEIPFYDKQSEVLSQVMYFPTVDAGNENKYVFKYQDGEPLQSKVISEQLSKIITVDYSDTYENRVEEYIDIAASGYFEGSRNVALTKLLGHMLNKNVDVVLCYELLKHWWFTYRDNNDHDSEQEYNTTFNSIYKKYLLEGGQ